jgi:hypothetical protein
MLKTKEQGCSHAGPTRRRGALGGKSQSSQGEREETKKAPQEKQAMTDDEVIRILIAKLGWSPEKREYAGTLNVSGWGRNKHLPPPGHVSLYPFSFLITSRDALAPVMEKLTNEEWDRFMYRICGNAEGARWLSFEQLRYVLSQPPNRIAHAIAEAIKP